MNWEVPTMRSRKSLFNAADLRVDFTRFAPLPALYTVGLAVMILTSLANVRSYYSSVSTIRSVIGTMAPIQFVYALLISQCLFGYLFDSRLSSAIHALPQTRGSRFRTHVFSGLLFSLLPHLILAVLCHFVRKEVDAMTGWWLLVSELQSVYFFGLAVLAALCAGNRVGGLMVYGLLTCLPMLLLFLVSTLVQPLMFGVEINTDHLEYCWPLAQMTGEEYMDIVTNWPDPYQDAVVQSITPNARSFVYLGVSAGLGALAVILAGQMYRRRQLECAGELLSVKWLNPLFLVLYVLAFGTLCQLLVSLFGDDNLNISLFVGIVLGYYTGLMLLQRQVNVFKLKTVPAAIGLCAAVLVPLMLLGLDVPGIIRKVPEENRIVSVSIGSSSINSGAGFTTESREDIAKLRTVHEVQVQSWEDWRSRNPSPLSILESTYNRNLILADAYDTAVFVRLTYKLTDGSTLRRSYRVPVDTEAGQACKAFLARPENMLGVSSREELLRQSIDSVDSYIYDGYGSHYVAQEDMPGLLNALYDDCEAGKLLPDVFMPGDRSVLYSVSIVPRGNDINIWLYIYDNGTETEQYLKTHLRHNAGGD